MQHFTGDDVGVFLAVCEAGSFATASRRVGLSPSAVAKAVARLEVRLTVRLFKRTTRTLSLTEEGAAYRDVCASARQQVECVEQAIRNLPDEPAGLVRISLPPLFGAHVIAPALYALARIWPKLRYHVTATTAPSDLVEGNVDIAVRIGETPETAGLMARRLGWQDVALCGSAEYFSRKAKPQTVEELGRHDLIGTPRNGKVLPWPFQMADGGVSMWTPDTRLLLEGSLLALAAIREGYGLGLVPRWLVEEDIHSGRILTVLDENIGGHLPVHVLWPASPIMLSRLRLTIDAIVAATRHRLS
ncbi:LysR family transcriptional regulator [Shinella sp. CPCC 101442]|uniref:LysR family transcriptional regulator n=1 Tax=Shinella sp. CPCC 101442 TaxID=2932265 RepID=UPI0021534A24|nr:LysR family transcriptional regulator [Shinella sp. CPCC 101442]MCR6502798.1 LysR family transcriptional regulator [Shinella sp. CPCC 101442]